MFVCMCLFQDRKLDQQYEQNAKSLLFPSVSLTR